MSLLEFGIVVLILIAAAYVVNYLFPTMPRAIRIFANIVIAFVLLFMVLDLFGLMSLPFKLT